MPDVLIPAKVLQLIKDSNIDDFHQRILTPSLQANYIKLSQITSFSNLTQFVRENFAQFKDDRTTIIFSVFSDEIFVKSFLLKNEGFCERKSYYYFTKDANFPVFSLQNQNSLRRARIQIFLIDNSEIQKVSPQNSLRVLIQKVINEFYLKEEPIKQKLPITSEGLKDAEIQTEILPEINKLKEENEKLKQEIQKIKFLLNSEKISEYLKRQDKDLELCDIMVPKDLKNVVFDLILQHFLKE